ncbi:MAG: hypothetical protein OSB46_15150 [Alphaproteobacteria bacterium]|nr:hypothetical protein [Alphaproteobacteria bacterium]
MIAARMKVGGQSTSDALYKRMRELIYGFSDNLERIRLLTQLARTHGRQDLDHEAEITLAAAWRTAWIHRVQDSYPNITVGVVTVMISIRKLRDAFDTAARILLIKGEDRSSGAQPKFQAPRAICRGCGGSRSDRNGHSRGENK